MAALPVPNVARVDRRHGLPPEVDPAVVGHVESLEERHSGARHRAAVGRCHLRPASAGRPVDDDLGRRTVRGGAVDPGGVERRAARARGRRPGSGSCRCGSSSRGSGSTRSVDRSDRRGPGVGEAAVRADRVHLIARRPPRRRMTLPWPSVRTAEPCRPPVTALLVAGESCRGFDQVRPPSAEYDGHAPARPAPGCPGTASTRRTAARSTASSGSRRPRWRSCR